MKPKPLNKCKSEYYSNHLHKLEEVEQQKKFEKDSSIIKLQKKSDQVAVNRINAQNRKLKGIQEANEKELTFRSSLFNSMYKIKKESKGGRKYSHKSISEQNRG